MSYFVTQRIRKLIDNPLLRDEYVKRVLREALELIEQPPPLKRYIQNPYGFLKRGSYQIETEKPADMTGYLTVYALNAKPVTFEELAKSIDEAYGEVDMEFSEEDVKPVMALARAVEKTLGFNFDYPEEAHGHD